MKLATFILAATACSSSASRVARPDRGATPSLAAARAAERGEGGPRDYTRAANLYEQLCERGHGSLEACVALIDAITEARGTSTDLRRVRDLGEVLCERGDPTSCFINLVIDQHAGRPAILDRADATQLEAQLETACESGDGRACELTIPYGDGGSAEDERRTKLGVACRAGRMAACGDLTIELALCGAPEVDAAAACEARILAAWRADAYDRDLAVAVDTLRDACRAGDARACAHLPTQRIAPEALCAAHDYGACAALGCLGDDAAKALALAHGADAPNCYVAYKHALTAWRRQVPRARFAPIVTDGQRPIGARSTPPWQAVRFQHHGGRDRRDWPRFDVYNLNDRAITELAVCLYAYDADGAQLATFAATPQVAIAANALVPLALDRGPAPALPADTVEVVIDYDLVRFAGDAQPTRDPARCPAQRPREQAGAYMRW